MSSMSESEVMDKLRQIVTKQDPADSYVKQKKIGQGASGSVYVAKILENALSPIAASAYKQNGPNGRVAIKTMDLRNQPRKELIVNEIIVMKESMHQNIVNYLDAFLLDGQNELWVVMEYMDAGALTDIIEANPVISEDQIAAICREVSRLLRWWLSCTNLRQTTRGLEHLHAQDIIHRDIKSDNVLLDSHGHVKISKFHYFSFDSICEVQTNPQPPTSRFRLLRQTHQHEIQARHHGRHALLDGARSGQAKGVRQQSGHLVARHHGHRAHRVRAPLPQRGAAQGPVPHRHQRHAEAQAPGEAVVGAEAVFEHVLVRGSEEPEHGEGFAAA